MLGALHQALTTANPLPIYGMNKGTVGFLMNAYDEENLLERINKATVFDLNPLWMKVYCEDGSMHRGKTFSLQSWLMGRTGS